MNMWEKGTKSEVALAQTVHVRKRFPALGHDVYHWPEFKAFATRLGIPWDLGTVFVTIELPLEGPVMITHKYQGETTEDALDRNGL
jgi:hypothetical protein